jgi:hypothetical protein
MCTFSHNLKIKCLRTHVVTDIFSCYGTRNTCPKSVRTIHVHGVHTYPSCLGGTEFNLSCNSVYSDLRISSGPQGRCCLPIIMTATFVLLPITQTWIVSYNVPHYWAHNSLEHYSNTTSHFLRHKIIWRLGQRVQLYVSLIFKMKSDYFSKQHYTTDLYTGDAVYILINGSFYVLCRWTSFFKLLHPATGKIFLNNHIKRNSSFEISTVDFLRHINSTVSHSSYTFLKWIDSPHRVHSHFYINHQSIIWWTLYREQCV